MGFKDGARLAAAICPADRAGMSDVSPTDDQGLQPAAVGNDDPVWVADIRRCIVDRDGYVTSVEPLQFRFRFTGWTRIDGPMVDLRFDINHDKHRQPTKAQFTECPESLRMAVESALHSHRGKAAGSPPPNLPALTEPALRHLEAARKHCAANGVDISWKQAHEWQVSIWDVTCPENAVYLHFGKRGLNPEHVAKREGNPESCAWLHALIKEGCTQ